MEARTWATTHVPQVLRTFMRLVPVSQEQLGERVGWSQRQVSRRLSVPGALAQEDLYALADLFGVEIATFYKPLPEAVADLMGSAKLDELRSGSSVLVAA